MSLFKKPSELTITKTIKMLLYGQPGIGKTTMALSAPNPVLFDFDGGVQRVNSAFQCPTLQVQSWEEAVQALDEIKTGEVDCESIVVDTAGKMLDYMSESIMKNEPKMRKRDGTMALQGYSSRKNMFITFLHEVSKMGKNIIFVAHEKEDKDGEQKIVRPEMGGSSLGDLIKELDLVGYVQAIGSERTVTWNPTEKFYAKNTCQLPAFQKIPVIVNEKGEVTQENDTLKKVFKYYENNLARIAEMRKDYAALIAEITEAISNITTAEEATEFAKSVAKTQVIWDSKVQARTMLSKRVEELSLKWNKDKKCYEQSAA